jgi:hypothetical protein
MPTKKPKRCATPRGHLLVIAHGFEMKMPAGLAHRYLPLAPFGRVGLCRFGGRVGSTYGTSRTRSRQRIDRYDVGHVVNRSKVEGRVAGQHGGDTERATLASINVELPHELA